MITTLLIKAFRGAVIVAVKVSNLKIGIRISHISCCVQQTVIDAVVLTCWSSPSTHILTIGITEKGSLSDPYFNILIEQL